MYGAVFTDAIVKDANFTDATLKDAKFIDCEGLDKKRLDQLKDSGAIVENKKSPPNINIK